MSSSSSSSSSRSTESDSQIWKPSYVYDYSEGEAELGELHPPMTSEFHVRDDDDPDKAQYKETVPSRAAPGKRARSSPATREVILKSSALSVRLGTSKDSVPLMNTFVAVAEAGVPFVLPERTDTDFRIELAKKLQVGVTDLIRIYILLNKNTGRGMPSRIRLFVGTNNHYPLMVNFQDGRDLLSAFQGEIAYDDISLMTLRIFDREWQRSLNYVGTVAYVYLVLFSIVMQMIRQIKGRLTSTVSIGEREVDLPLLNETLVAHFANNPTAQTILTAHTTNLDLVDFAARVNTAIIADRDPELHRSDLFTYYELEKINYHLLSYLPLVIYRCEPIGYPEKVRQASILLRKEVLNDTLNSTVLQANINAVIGEYDIYHARAILSDRSVDQSASYNRELNDFSRELSDKFKKNVAAQSFSQNKAIGANRINVFSYIIERELPKFPWLARQFRIMRFSNPHSKLFLVNTLITDDTVFNQMMEWLTDGYNIILKNQLTYITPLELELSQAKKLKNDADVRLKNLISKKGYPAYLLANEVDDKEIVLARDSLKAASDYERQTQTLLNLAYERVPFRPTDASNGGEHSIAEYMVTYVNSAQFYGERQQAKREIVIRWIKVLFDSPAYTIYTGLLASDSVVTNIKKYENELRSSFKELVHQALGAMQNKSAIVLGEATKSIVDSRTLTPGSVPVKARTTTSSSSSVKPELVSLPERPIIPPPAGSAGGDASHKTYSTAASSSASSSRRPGTLS
jgi:hypothetical protein